MGWEALGHTEEEREPSGRLSLQDPSWVGGRDIRPACPADAPRVSFTATAREAVSLEWSRDASSSPPPEVRAVSVAC